MRTLLPLFVSLILVCLLSACGTAPSRAPSAAAGASATMAATPADTARSDREPGRRAALWTGIGFALYAIYEANNDDDRAAPPATGLSCASLKCW